MPPYLTNYLTNFQRARDETDKLVKVRGQKEKGKKSDKEKGFHVSLNRAEDGRGPDLEDRIAMMERKIDQ